MSTIQAPSEIIVIAKSSADLSATPAGVSARSGAKVSGLDKMLRTAKLSLTPLFGESEVRARSAMGPSMMQLQPDAPDPGSFYCITGEVKNTRKILTDLLNEPTIEGAYLKPGGEPPVRPEEQGEAPPQPGLSLDMPPGLTPDFTSHQGYLEVAPGGVNARFAWTKPGGRGEGMRVIDLEWGWNFNHEDLLVNSGGLLDGSNSTDNHHGTAVLGEIGGDHNTRGVHGISPNARVSTVSFVGNSSATAIRKAADRLRAGDIMLLEIHRAGPRNNFQARTDQHGYIAIEWWPDDFAAILYATSRGILVVEAAGNGAQNLDDAIYSVRPAGFPASWRNPFNRTNPQCGAILVGAGAPPPGTHGRDHGPDRSRLDFSNYGAALDAQGWGREVTTTGYGGLFNDSVNQQYTDTFSGTSSASPIVVGALACMQGWLRAAGRPLRTPAQARTLLRTSGSLQQAAPGRPTSQRIGRRPDLRALHGKLFPKTILADKLVKESDKLFKEGEKLAKEIEKPVKEIKEFEKNFKEKDKDLVEGFQDQLGNLRPVPTQDAFTSQRLAALEAQVAALTQALQMMASGGSHFIPPELRPDLNATEDDFGDDGSEADPGDHGAG
jgi:hypothetical protein